MVFFKLTLSTNANENSSGTPGNSEFGRPLTCSAELFDRIEWFGRIVRQNIHRIKTAKFFEFKLYTYDQHERFVSEFCSQRTLPTVYEHTLFFYDHFDFNLWKLYVQRMCLPRLLHPPQPKSCLNTPAALFNVLTVHSSVDVSKLVDYLVLQERT